MNYNSINAVMHLQPEIFLLEWFAAFKLVIFKLAVSESAISGCGLAAVGEYTVKTSYCLSIEPKMAYSFPY